MLPALLLDLSPGMSVLDMFASPPPRSHHLGATVRSILTAMRRCLPHLTLAAALPCRESISATVFEKRSRWRRNDAVSAPPPAPTAAPRGANAAHAPQRTPQRTRGAQGRAAHAARRPAATRRDGDGVCCSARRACAA